MAYHDELLEQALTLVNREPRHPKQASLRRAVSAAYYALFHLLISEAVANWKHPAQRAALARAFDHKTMKEASNRLQDSKRFPFTGEDPETVKALRSVAKTFTRLQDKRHLADYDNGTTWRQTDALSQVDSAQEAFQLWRGIRNHPIAQDYLVQLFVKKRD